jgi:hypothetical protein
MTDFVYRQWPHDQTTRLKQLWWVGKSAAECCRILGATSPRAVKEKVDREGFTRDPSIKEVARGDLVQPLHRANGELITMETVRENECRWMFAVEPTWDAPLCGRPTVGGSWCAGHRLLCFGKQAAPC